MNRGSAFNRKQLISLTAGSAIALFGLAGALQVGPGKARASRVAAVENLIAEQQRSAAALVEPAPPVDAPEPRSVAVGRLLEQLTADREALNLEEISLRMRPTVRQSAGEIVGIDVVLVGSFEAMHRLLGRISGYDQELRFGEVHLHRQPIDAAEPVRLEMTLELLTAGGEG